MLLALWTTTDVLEEDEDTGATTAGLNNDEIPGIGSCLSKFSFFFRYKASLGAITKAMRAKQIT